MYTKRLTFYHVLPFGRDLTLKLGNWHLTYLLECQLTAEFKTETQETWLWFSTFQSPNPKVQLKKKQKQPLAYYLRKK